jgi:hypothetical protein
MIEVAPESVHTKVSNMEEAILYCQFLEVDGSRGWRVPTYEEWVDSFIGRDNSFAHKLQRCIVSENPMQTPHTFEVNILKPVRDI